jgi:hypothetical protein
LYLFLQNWTNTFAPVKRCALTSLFSLWCARSLMMMAFAAIRKFERNLPVNLFLKNAYNHVINAELSVKHEIYLQSTKLTSGITCAARTLTTWWWRRRFNCTTSSATATATPLAPRRRTISDITTWLPIQDCFFISISFILVPLFCFFECNYSLGDTPTFSEIYKNNF